MVLTSEELAWLKLSLVEGLETKDIFRMGVLGDAESILDASYGTLVKLVGEKKARAIRMSEESESFEKACEWLETTPDASLLCLPDKDYPPLMIEAGIAPLVLFLRGNRSLFNPKRLHVTIMGSGHPDKEGEYNAREFGESFGKERLAFSTGLYPGVESIFLRAAVTQGIAEALVWASTGPDRIWPREESDVLRAVLQGNGLLVSPFAPGKGITEEGKSYQATCRLAAASGLFVIRASRQCEALKLARLAGDWGRDVLTIPGSIHDPQSKGCHYLLKQGARVIESVEDVKEGFFGRL